MIYLCPKNELELTKGLLLSAHKVLNVLGKHYISVLECKQCFRVIKKKS